jgi:tetratricopeptide (TPR) repeat protein
VAEELARQRSYAGNFAKFQPAWRRNPATSAPHVAGSISGGLISRRSTTPEGLINDARRRRELRPRNDQPRARHNADAKDGFGWAARSLEFRSAAYEQLAEIYVVEKQLERAAEYARRSLDYNAYNLNARQLQAVLFRLGNDREAAVGALEILTGPSQPFRQV